VELALRELGIWEEFLKQPQRRSHLTLSCWSEPSISERPAITSPYGASFHVSRPSFDAFLVAAARATGVRVISPGRVEHLVRSARGPGFDVKLETAVGFEGWHSRFLVDATGRSASIARRLGATRSPVDRLIGVARWFDAPNLAPAVLVESTPNGWWYSAPTPERGAVALWLTDADEPAARAHHAEVWESCLTAAPHTRARLADLTPTGPARSFAAAPVETTWVAADDWLPVGDAAIAFDPVSGNGLAFALRSALEATAVFGAARGGRFEWFERYRAGVRDVYIQHLARRAELYAAVRRWPGSRFWARPRDHRTHAAARTRSMTTGSAPATR
jgi:flavin-dependent dehydrogenase